MSALRKIKCENADDGKIQRFIFANGDRQRTAKRTDDQRNDEHVWSKYSFTAKKRCEIFIDAMQAQDYSDHRNQCYVNKCTLFQSKPFLRHEKQTPQDLIMQIFEIKQAAGGYITSKSGMRLQTEQKMPEP